MTLINEFQQLDSILIEAGGELTEELENALALNERNLSPKVDTYKLYMDHLEKRAEYFDAIEKQAKQAKQMFYRAQDAIKDRMKMSMTNLGVTEMQGDTYRFKLVDGKSKLIIESESELAEEYFQLTTVKEVNKEKVLQTLETGLHVVGARLEPSKQLRSYIKK